MEHGTVTLDSPETLGDFSSACTEMGLHLTAHQRDQFRAYHKLLLEWNARINLVSRQDQHRIFTRHFVDSLSILPHLRVRFPCRAADLGSGAGLPGIPLKILLPELDLTLIECKRKKALFLERLCSELGLDLCTVVRSRAEELAGAREYAASYHLVLARLVSSTARVCALARPLLAPGGLLICYKGPEGIDDLLSVSCVLQPFGCVSLPHALSRPAAFVLFVRK